MVAADSLPRPSEPEAPKTSRPETMLIPNPAHPVWDHRDYKLGPEPSTIPGSRALPVKHFTDSQITAGWLQGQAVVQKDRWRAGFHEITRNIHELIQGNEIQTIRRTSWVTQWVRREYNRAADHLAGWVLRAKRDIVLANFAWSPSANTQLYLFTDGAKNDDGVSCGAVLFEVGQDTRCLILAEGRKMDDHQSALEAEVEGVRMGMNLVAHVAKFRNCLLPQAQDTTHPLVPQLVRIAQLGPADI